MDMMHEEEVACPHCGAPHVLLVDATESTGQYIEDCSVCCRPMTVTVETENGELLNVWVEAA